MKPIPCLLILLLSVGNCLAQPFTDGRTTDRTCINYQRLVEQKPKEVLFGVHINPNGDVYFVMNNLDWFRRLFVPGMGITADIVARDRYSCNNYHPGNGLFRGYVMPPMRQENFKTNMQNLVGGQVSIKLGKVPPELRKKEIEANLVILIQNKVAYYTNFLDIDRSGWDLLPMGLYTDTLLNINSRFDTAKLNKFTYEQKVQVVVPFARNKDSYEGKDIQRIYDSLQLKRCVIKKVDIRAYSSVEGPEAINRQLMKGRANSMVTALKKIQPGLNRLDIMTAENWLDFYQDITNTGFRDLTRLTRAEVKLKLLDKEIADSLEPLLAKERKAILTIYYGQKTGLEDIRKDSILNSFSQAIAEKKIDQARRIQKEIFERISDNRLPEDYLDKLEVPREKSYWELLSDNIIYKYWLNLSGESEALQAFKELLVLDPDNGKINYNICALTLFEWRYSILPDSLGRLHNTINGLEKKGIPASLVKRMLVNYHILLSFNLLSQYKYDEKDKAVQFIKENYQPLQLTDEDRFSLAKYFSFYSQQEWAEELISPRIDKLDVSEDLLFYYVNLGFFKPGQYDDDAFRKALLNASTINRQRFCRFFNSTNNGGVGLQLLEEGLFRQLYCENCVQLHL